MSLAVPKEVKIEFLKKDISISKWSRDNNFDKVMVVYVLSGKAKGGNSGRKGGEQVKQIVKALKRDFPQLFEKGLVRDVVGV